jgi:hypothetical protein
MLHRFLKEHPNIHKRLYVTTPEAIKLKKQESLNKFQKDYSSLRDSRGREPIFDDIMAKLDILYSEK